MSFGLRRRGERGAAAVEFALILPIFLMLLFGIIDFGYMINRSAIINNAARDAVRVASLHGDEAEIRAAADQTLNGVPDATVEMTCRTSGGGSCSFADRETTDIAIVTVRYQHRLLTPVGMFVPGGFDLTRKAEMRIE